MHAHPDYSAAYVILQTDGAQEGHGLTFTIGRGNEVVVTAIQAFAPLVVGSASEEFRRSGRVLTAIDQRKSVALDWSREGRYPSGDCRSDQRMWEFMAKTQGKPLWSRWLTWRQKNSCAH